MFSGETSPTRALCVGLWELMKQRLLRSFGLIGWRGFAGQMCLCFGFDGLFCFYGMLLGVWGNTGCCSIDHPLYMSKILLVAA